ncbi:MAG TPA: hypothetical protein VJ757_01945 [Pseudonocardiaceae bacterium]|nr:hypothetical protein [Pseudonocardiaceae bacterium]
MLVERRLGSQLARSGWVLAKRVHRVYREEVGATDQALMLAWSGFGMTFSFTRALTLWLRAGHGPAGGGIVIRGRHIHHYNLGIILLTLVGAVALCGLERHRRHPLTATAYGSGIALVVDELALLIDLQDVYWAKDGRWSVDAAVATTAVGGLYLAAVPFWHRAARQVVTTCAEAASGQLSTAAL